MTIVKSLKQFCVDVLNAGDLTDYAEATTVSAVLKVACIKAGAGSTPDDIPDGIASILDFYRNQYGSENNPPYNMFVYGDDDDIEVKVSSGSKSWTANAGDTLNDIVKAGDKYKIKLSKADTDAKDLRAFVDVDSDTHIMLKNGGTFTAADGSATVNVVEGTPKKLSITTENAWLTVMDSDYSVAIEKGNDAVFVGENLTIYIGKPEGTEFTEATINGQTLTDGATAVVSDDVEIILKAEVVPQSEE